MILFIQAEVAATGNRDVVDVDNRKTTHRREQHQKITGWTRWKKRQENNKQWNCRYYASRIVFVMILYDVQTKDKSQFSVKRKLEQCECWWIDSSMGPKTSDTNRYGEDVRFFFFLLLSFVVPSRATIQPNQQLSIMCASTFRYTANWNENRLLIIEDAQRILLVGCKIDVRRYG